MPDCNSFVDRRQPNRSQGSVPYARVTDAQNSASTAQLPRMVVRLAGEEVISKHGLTDLQAMPNSPEQPWVSLDQLTGRICPVCQLSTPPLTTEKIFAVTECAHMLCYECALRLHFTSSKPSAEGIDCPTCGQPSSQVILTREQFVNVDQVKAFAQRWLTALNTTGPTGQCPTPMVNFDNLVLFDPTFSDDFLPLLDALMTIEERLRTFERKVLRKIFGPVFNGTKNRWEKRSKKELYQRFAKPDVVQVMKKRDFNG
ncbi:hypothetical protein TYRP_018703 [Tyrophagus putrescentiae]|nr:hypothetical protein TYRP_018703 [Tyrophagus putrescentiae]